MRDAWARHKVWIVAAISFVIGAAPVAWLALYR